MLAAAGSRWRLANVLTSGDYLYWVEARPLEGGRNVLMRKRGHDPAVEITPEGFNVRTRVHEYGGGAYAVKDATVFFSNYADQRMYRQDDAGEPRPITPEPSQPAGLRYADARITPDGDSLVCVREIHGDGEPRNEVALIPADGGDAATVVSGADFYAFPRVSGDGTRIAWTSWRHPRMPWDGTELRVADFDGHRVSNERHVAGGTEESIFQPEWSPDGVLHFVSDRTGWWNLYRDDGVGPVPLARKDSEFGRPQWVFGMSQFAFLDDGTIVCSYSSNGRDRLAVVRRGELQDLDLPYSSAEYLQASGRRVFFIGATETTLPEVVQYDVTTGVAAPATEVEAPALAADFISVAEPIEYPTEDGLTAHALFYPPRNPDFAGPEGDLPPLLVCVHGGPTSQVTADLDLSIQYWTSRGFAVVDVNYGGSAGYGRQYRLRLNGAWGIVDTNDSINAARYLAREGKANENALAIRGGSAGGWTTLCALVFHDVFDAGANYYGVSDLMGFVDDTHKFEARYLDSLVGPWPDARELYRERSPINFMDRLTAPMIILQGLEDEIVPPSQSEVIVQALDKLNLPYAYLAFEGEQHGFRKADTVTRCVEAELFFYSKIFGFTPADEIEPLEIKNL